MGKMSRTGENNSNWKGGQIKVDGYVYILMPGHHRAIWQGRYVKRADLVLEEKLGRPLQPGEFAHHKDRVRDNDAPDNLELRMRSTHREVVYPTGKDHPSWKASRVCPRCGGPKDWHASLCRKCHVATGEASKQSGRGWETRRKGGKQNGT